MIRLNGDGTFPVDVVGESQYQDNLRAICGPRTEQGENRIVDAILVLEDNSPYDPHAVRVDIDHRTVGHLSRHAAPVLRDQLAKAGFRDSSYLCRANIRGGWQREDDIGSYGVWLDLPPSLPVAGRKSRYLRLLFWFLLACLLGCVACAILGWILQACGAT